VRSVPSVGAIVAAIPDLALAGMFLITWVSPQTLGEKPLRYLMLVMLMEFIIVHSSAFLGTVVYSDLLPGKKTLAVVGLGAFYTTFVGAFAMMFREWWPVTAFWGLILNRLANVLLGNVPEGRERDLVMASWAVSAAAYVGCTFITVFLPLPRIGLTPDVVAGQALPGEGLWIDQPHRLVAAGFLYFAIQGAWNLFGEQWLQPRATKTTYGPAEAGPYDGR
jgi:hypothetical protein